MIEYDWIEADGQLESLAIALRAVLARNGVACTYEELVARLGLGNGIVATEQDTLGWWQAYDRDRCLVPVAESFGLRLRELHPPGAARDLGHSAEFDRHFRDSYLPLIEAALEHGQAVLAWRGWPPPRDRMWGVIGGMEGRTIAGYSLWHRGEPLPMTGPAHQVYVVEAFRAADSPHERDAVRVFCEVLARTVDRWANRGAPDRGLLGGPDAYAAWHEVLLGRGPRVDPVMPAHRQHAQAVRMIVAAREALASWLRTVGPKLGADLAEAAAGWAQVCTQIAETLLPFRADEAAQRALEDAGGAREMCAAIEQACALENAAHERLRPVLEAARGPS